MRLLAPFALIIVALTTVVWLDDTPPEADLIFVNQNEVFTLDPQRMSYIQDLRLAHALYEGLVRWDNHDYSILPAAADLPTVSEDGLTYTFEIRPEAVWANGDPVTAHDFVYAWQRALLPDTAADYSNMFFAIEGGAAFFDWRAGLTAGFAAEPWSDAATATPTSVRAAVGRLERLLDADPWPAGVARPPDAARPRIRAALESLRAAARLETGLETTLGDAADARTWVKQLDAPDSRAAEAAWMWEETQRRFRDTVGLEVRGDRTLVVRLTRPTAYLLDLLCFGVFFPVHRPTVEGWPADHPRSPRGWIGVEPPSLASRQWVRLDPSAGKLEQKHEWAKPHSHVGNGTHRLVEWRYKRDLRLEPSPTFHDAARVRSGSILARTIEDTNTAVLAYESGHVDWLVDVSTDYQADMLEEFERYRARHADELAALMADGRTFDEALAALPAPGPGERRNIRVFPTFGTDFYSFNCRPLLNDRRPNPFARAEVRRAFAMAIDKRVIVERVTRLDEPILRTLIPPDTIEGYNSPHGLDHDPDAARATLRAAGWEDRDADGFVEDAQNRPFPVVDLLYTTNIPRYKWISLELKSQWERELGVRVELRATETKFYREDLKQGEFMIARGRWYGDYGDPTTFLDLCKSTDGNNDRKYKSRKVDDWLEQASLERDPEKRMRILEECERYLFEEEVPILPLCQLVQVYMFEPNRVRGLSEHPRLTQFLWQMEVDDR
jgi:oligopeptide transport system substrate-binding protein